MQPKKSSVQSGRPRIVDVIAEGLSVVLVRPWLLAIPILIDLIYWFGIKIQPTPLMNSLIKLVNDADVEDSSDVVSTLTDLMSSNILQLGSAFVPSMLAGVPREDIYQIRDQVIWTPASSGLVLLVVVGLILIGSLISMIYSVPIADAVMGRKRTFPTLAQAIIRAWIRMLLLIGLIIGGLFAIAIPAGIIAAILSLVGLNLLPLLSFFMLLAVIAAVFYGYFVFDAIVVADAGPITAIRYSAQVVHKNFRPVVGLILATLLLSTGIPEIAESLLDQAPGLVLAVGIQALIATGATAASLLFFVDCLRRQRPELLEIAPDAPAFDLSRQEEPRS